MLAVVPPVARTPECHPERKHCALGFCRSCYNHANSTKESRDRATRNRRSRPAENRARSQRHYLKQYGLTAEQYRDMLVGQAGRCLVCLRVSAKTLVVDHDHVTGRVRGLLCHPCNLAIGQLGDDASRLDRGAAYLRAAA